MPSPPASDAGLTPRQREAADLSRRGNALLAAGCKAEALDAQQRAAAIWPKSAAVHCNLALALRAAGRRDAAEATLRRAVALEPDLPEAQNLLANLLFESGQHEAALAAFEALLSRWPTHPTARHHAAIAANNLGNAHVAENRTAEAQAAYARAREFDPESPDVRYNEALAQLVAGNFAEGLEGYENRFRTKGRMGPRAYGALRWDGRAPLAGRSILLWAEQGLGDTIQFARYIPFLVQAGAQVHVEAHPPLHNLLRASFPEIKTLATRGQPLPQVDYQCPIPSLPLAFGTRLETIPRNVPYLRAPAARSAHWQERLSRYRRPRVGVVWAGNPGHQYNHLRSLTLTQFIQAIPESDLSIVVLQKALADADAAELARHPAWTDLHAELNDFAETAAIVEQLDLVISVDTSVAHLAGALGRPVWILSAFSPDWRWLLDRSDSPWYPTARLFRQPSPGAWPPVLEAVRKALS